MSLNSLIASVAALQRLEGVAGILLFKGRNTVHKQLPFSEGRALDLMDVLGQMLEGYQQVRRKIRQVYLEFDGASLLLVIQDEVVLAFLLTARADPDLAFSAAIVLLEDHADVLAGLSTAAAASRPLAQDGVEELVATTPRALRQLTDKADAVMNQWGAVRRHVEALLGRVMGRAQVTMMIDRVLARRGTNDPYRLPPHELRNLAVALIDQVPNTAKRQALTSELESVLAELNL